MKKEEKIEQDQDQQDKKLLGLWPMAADKNYLCKQAKLFVVQSYLT